MLENKNFNLADELRDKLKKMHFEIEDTPDGTKWYKTTKIVIFNYIPFFFYRNYRLIFARFFSVIVDLFLAVLSMLWATRKFSFFKVFKISFYRILRCHPFGSRYDPITHKEDFLIKKFQQIISKNLE